MPSCSGSTSGAPAPATPASGRASTDRSVQRPRRGVAVARAARCEAARAGSTDHGGRSDVAVRARSEGRAVIRPTLDEFRTLARTHTVIPVWREILADLTTPVAAFARLVGDETGFLLESVEHGEARWSRWSFIGRNPLATLTARGLDVAVTGEVPAAVPRDRGVLAALEALLGAWHAPALADLPP